MASDYRPVNGVGRLPGPDNNLRPPFVSTFGMASNHTSEEDCHFCLDPITMGPVIRLHCCGHGAHSNCFHEWSYHSRLVSDTVRCAYCRARYDHSARCFLCHNAIGQDRPIRFTNCCRFKVHAACVDLIADDIGTLECGHCYCLWEAV